MFLGWLYMLLVPGLAPSGSSRWWLCLLPGALALTVVVASNSRARNWRNVLNFERFRRGEWTWWLLLMPAVVARSWVVSLPAVALLALIAIARRRSWRLRFELEGLRFLVLATMLSPVTVIGYARLLGNTPASELTVACFMLSFAAVALHASALCGEFTNQSASTWLAQPLSVSRLVFEKWVTPSAVALLSFAQVELVRQPSAHHAVIVSPMFALVLGGLTVPFALIFKDTLTSAFLTFLAVLLPLLAPRALSGDVEFDDPWVRAVAWSLPVVSVFSLVGSLARARRLSLRSVPPTHLVAAFSLGRTTALRAQVLKELRLQVPAAGLMATTVVLWAATRGEVRGGVTLVLGLVVAALAGITPTLSEKQYGTSSVELALLPGRWVWRVKTGVSALVAFVGGVLVPGGLMLVVEPSDFGWSTVLAAASWGAFVAATFALGVVGSVLFKELKNAFAFVVAGVQVALFVQLVSALCGRRAGVGLSLSVGSLHAVPLDHPLLDAFMGLALNALPSAVVAWGALALARRAQLASSLSVASTLRVLFGTVAFIVVVNALNCLVWSQATV